MFKLLGLTVELIRVEYSRSEIEIMHKDTIGKASNTPRRLGWFSMAYESWRSIILKLTNQSTVSRRSGRMRGLHSRGDAGWYLTNTDTGREHSPPV